MISRTCFNSTYSCRRRYMFAYTYIFIYTYRIIIFIILSYCIQMKQRLFNHATRLVCCYVNADYAKTMLTLFFFFFFFFVFIRDFFLSLLFLIDSFTVIRLCMSNCLAEYHILFCVDCNWLRKLGMEHSHHQPRWSDLLAQGNDSPISKTSNRHRHHMNPMVKRK